MQLLYYLGYDSHSANLHWYLAPTLITRDYNGTGNVEHWRNANPPLTSTLFASDQVIPFSHNHIVYKSTNTR